jgi:hypothetical protein
MTYDAPPSSRGVPPPSSRSTFPLVQKSRAMVEFVSRITQVAQPMQIIPILTGPNRLEINALIREIQVRKRVLPDQCMTVSGRASSPLLMLSGEAPKLLVYTNGDKIEPHIQAKFAGHATDTIHMCLIAFISKPVNELTETTGHEILPAWSKSFAKRTRKVIPWPLWQERTEDRIEIISEIYNRRTPPPGKERPAMDKSFMDALLTNPYVGVDEVEQDLIRAFNTYIRTGDRGRLTANHLMGPQKQRVQEDRGHIRQTPTPVPPSAT